MRNLFFYSAFALLLTAFQVAMVDKFVMNVQSDLPVISSVIKAVRPSSQNWVIDPPAWVQYTLFATGFVTLMYAWTLPEVRQHHGHA